MINVTAVHMVSGAQHQHIGSVRWANPQTAATGQSTREEMVDWINGGGVAHVYGQDGSVARVGVVNARPPYIQTYADGNWNDNLLALPGY